MTRLEELLATLKWGRMYGRTTDHAQAALFEAVLLLTERAVESDERDQADHDRGHEQ